MQIKPYSPIGLLILLETMLLYACTADEWISHPEMTWYNCPPPSPPCLEALELMWVTRGTNPFR